MGKPQTHQLEAATRKKIDSILTSLGWNIFEGSPDCNVFCERAKLVEQNKKFKGKKPDYVLYQSGTNTAIAIIEAKRPGQSIDEALTQAEERYARALGVKIIFAVDGAFVKSLHLEENKPLTIDGELLTELPSEQRLLRFTVEGANIAEVTEQVKHTREELIKIFKWANDLLRREGLRNLDRFVEFANILFIKIISEIEDERERNGQPRQLAKELCWDSFSNMPDPKMMLNYINNTVLKDGLAKEYNHSDDIFQEHLKIRNPDTVQEIVAKLSKLRLLNTESEIKGDAFEYFLKSLASGNDLGEYFTPRHIVKLIVTLVDPKFGNTVLDPFCGTGGFLIDAFRHMKRGIDEKDTTLMRQLKERSVFGIELTDTYKIAKMNMIITGDGHNNIIQDDTAHNVYWSQKDLQKIFEEYKIKGFDVILSNIPYGQTTDYGHLYPIPSNQGDSVFIQHMIKALNTGGRCGVIIPEGFLFKSEHRKVREYLLRECGVNAIISLPAGIFQPYTMAKTDILIFEKGKPTREVWFYTLENDGYELATRRTKISENDIPDLLSKWTERKPSTKSWIAGIEEIRGEKFDLLPQTYRPQKKTGNAKGFVTFAQILKPSTKKISVNNDETTYRQVKVQWWGHGATLRRELEGKKIKTKKQFIAEEGDVIVSKIDARVGALAVIPKSLEGAIVTTDFPLFKVDQKQVNIEYLDRCLRYGNYASILSTFAKGTTKRQRVKPTDVLKLTVYLPSKEEQEQIVERVKLQESVIANIDQTIDTINEGIIDKSDFEGEWPLEKLEDVCGEIMTGGTPSRANPDYFKGTIPWVKILDMNKLDYITSTKEKITKEALANCNAKMLAKGTVLISIFASVGTVSILGIDACTNQAIAALIPKTDKIIDKYLMFYLHTMKPYYLQHSRGIAQKNINSNILKSVNVPVPPKNIQKDIVSKIEARKSVILEMEKTKTHAQDIINRIIQDKCGVDNSASSATPKTSSMSNYFSE